LKEGADYPYYETRGFSPEHVKLENRLCAIDEAGCSIRDFKCALWTNLKRKKNAIAKL